jgi:hypothetical protein
MLITKSVRQEGEKEERKEGRGKESGVFCVTPAIPALRRLRQEELEFEVTLTYIARPCLNKKTEERFCEETQERLKVVDMIEAHFYLYVNIIMKLIILYN